jgi:bacteriocin-like protein
MEEIIIELSETELKQISGGAGSASLVLSATASGTSATVSGTGTIATTASSARLSGTISSSST